VNETKRCTTCGEVKPLTEFHRDRTKPDGRRSRCKLCRAGYQREYYEENREKIAEYQREYYEENREKIAEYQREYREENREKRAGYQREYREENREAERERSREYCRCVKNPACPAVGRRGAEFVTYTCEVCGTEFRRLKSKVAYDYERRGSLPRFCSTKCKGVSQRKGYKSPYARRIERIQKEVRV